MAKEMGSLLKSYKENTKAPKNARWASNIYYIISIIAVIIGILSVLGFLVLFLIIALMGEAFGGTSAGDLGIITITTGAVAIALGSMMVAIGVLGLFIARGLRRGYAWARITAIIVSGLSVLGFMFSLNQLNVLNLVIAAAHGFVLYAMLFDEDSKKFFK